jgi:hypothetical protein
MEEERQLSTQRQNGYMGPVPIVLRPGPDVSDYGLVAQKMTDARINIAIDICLYLSIVAMIAIGAVGILR